MNDISVSEVLSTVPAGLPAEHRRNRLTALLGLAVSQLVQIPGSPLEGGNRTAYFSENTEAVRKLLFTFNEAVPFSVDRAMDIGYQVWNVRYSLVHECTPELLLGESMIMSIGDILPGRDLLQMTPADVRTMMALIKLHSV